MQRIFALGLAGIVVLGWAGRPLAAGTFGTKDPHLLDLKGSIYLLPDSVESMPESLDKQKVEGTIYTDRLDIPVRAFTEGFPGVSKRFEWFGIVYQGAFQISAPGEYGWKLGSDDGSILWIDGKKIIDNDGVHGWTEAEGTTKLAKGPHAMKVWFFQGPAEELGLQMWVTPPRSEQKIFSMKDFGGDVAGALSRVKGEATKDGIRVSLDATVLFDTGKFDLKPAGKATFGDVGKIIAGYPGCTVRIDGHTDSQGDAATNQKLSEDRAKSVKAALAVLPECKEVTFQTEGHGKNNPVADNATAAGRAQNRRVEITIVPKN